MMDYGDIAVPAGPQAQMPQGGFRPDRIPDLTGLIGGTGHQILNAFVSNFGPMGALNAAVTLGGLPQKAVQTALGGGSQENFQQAVQQGAQQAVALRQQQHPVVQAALAGPAALLPAQAQEALLQFGADFATDPVNMIGMGLPGRLRQMIPTGSRLQAIAPALEGAAKGEKFIQDALNQIVGAIPRGLAQTGKVVPFHRTVYETKPDVRTPSGELLQLVSERQSQNLFDYFKHRHPESQYKLALRPVIAQTEEMIHTGRNIPRDIMDMLNLEKNTPITPISAEVGKYLQDKQAMRQSLREIESMYSQAPNGVAKIGFIEALRDLETLNAAAWNQAFTPYRAAIAQAPAVKGGGGRDTLATQMYADAGRQVGVNLRATRDAIEDIFQEASRNPLDPTTDDRLSQVADAALVQIRQAMQTPTLGLYQVTDKGRRLKGDYMRVRFEEMVERVNAVNKVADNVQSTVGDLAGPLTAPQQVLGRIFQREEDIGQLLRGNPGVLGEAPEFMHGPYKNMSRQLATYAAEALHTRTKMEDAIGEIYERFAPGVQYQKLQTTGSTTGQEVLQHINDSLHTLAQTNALPIPLVERGAPGTYVTNAQDLLGIIHAYASPDTYRKLAASAEKFKGADLLIGNPIMAGFDRAARGLGAQYGIKNDEHRKGLTEVLRLSNDFFKEQALTSLSYPITNAVGVLVNSTLSGVPAWQQMKEIVRQAGYALRDNERHPASHYATWMERTGINDFGASRGDASHFMEAQAQAAQGFNDVQRFASERIGRPKLAVGAATLGALGGNFSTPSDATEQERYQNIAMGAGVSTAWYAAAAPWLNKNVITRLARGVEDAGRGEVSYMVGTEAHQNSIPAFRQIIEDAFAGAGRTRTFVAGHQAAPRRAPDITGKNILPIEGTTRVTPKSGAQQQVLEILEKERYEVSPEIAARLLREAGVPGDTAQRAATRWRNINGSISQQMERAAAEVHFDYQDLNNFEDFVRQVLPFSTWAFKALPFFAKHLSEKPALFLTLAEIEVKAEQARKEQGLTGRTAGASHVPIADGFWSMVLGYPTMAFYNRYKGFLPMADSSRVAAEMERPQAPMEAVENAFQLFGLPGFGPGPAALGRIAGAYGEAPPSNMLRASGALEGAGALTGVNRGRGISIGSAITTPERRIREALGQEVGNPGELAIMNRLDEAYMRNTGRPISQGGADSLNYLQAKVNKSGPEWDWAAESVARERGARALLGMGASQLVPQALVTPEEARIRQARVLARVLEPNFSRELQEAAHRNPTAPARPEVVKTMLAASQYMSDLHSNGEIPEMVVALLNNGTNADMNQIKKFIVAAQAKANPVAGGYGQSGSPQEADIQNALALMSRVSTGVPGGSIVDAFNQARGSPEYYRNPGTGPMMARLPELLKPAAQAVSQAKEGVKLQSPIMADYLEWKKKNPHGDVDDFLSTRRR